MIDQITQWGHHRMASVLLIDATFVCDAPKLISESLLSLSAMIALELPRVNVLSKVDLVDDAEVENILDCESASVLWQRRKIKKITLPSDIISKEDRQRIAIRRSKQNRLAEAICSLLDDYSMVNFIPLNITDEESIDHVLAHIDHTIQYGEDLEVRVADENDIEEEE